jgi:hypothetical protein
VNADGEVFAASKCEYTLLPHAVSIFVPA